jgi:polyhydroxybutyrate depolymerase
MIASVYGGGLEAPQLAPTAALATSHGTPGTIEDEVTFEGRPVRLIFPRSFRPEQRHRLPLVVHLHGALDVENAPDLELDASGYRALPSKFPLIIAAPRAAPHPIVPLFLWNDGALDPVLGPTGVDDAAYLVRLVDAMLANYPVDPHRVYLYGYSNGGAMALRTACEQADRFAAVAAGASAMFPEVVPCNPTRPIPILEFHSKDDQVIPFEGGFFIPGVPATIFPGTIEMMQQWGKRNGCRGEFKFGTQPVLDLDAAVPGKETTINRIKQCPWNGLVHLWSLEDADHSPLSFGFGPDGVKTLAKKTWQFLRPHKR